MPAAPGKISAGLLRAWNAVQDAYKSAEAQEALNRVGEVFRTLADKPGYFVTNKELPKSYNDYEAAKMLARKHDIGLEYKDIYGMPELRAGELSMEPRMRQGYTSAMDHTPAWDIESILPYVAEGKVDPRARVWQADTLSAQPGTGEAKKFYPAAYEWLLSRPGDVIESNSLTPNNQWRRSGNMVGMLEKYGKEAGDRLIIGEEQLSPRHNDVQRKVAYHRAPVEGQIGALNALSAARTGELVGAIGNRLFSRFDAPSLSQPEQFVELLRLANQADKLGLKRGQAWDPTTDVSADYFPSLAELIRDAAEAGLVARPVGVDSLRRAAITNDALNRGVTGPGLLPQTFLHERLARREGGTVPGNTLGPLSQLCSCGAK